MDRRAAPCIAIAGLAVGLAGGLALGLALSPSRTVSGAEAARDQPGPARDRAALAPPERAAPDAPASPEPAAPAAARAASDRQPLAPPWAALIAALEHARARGWLDDAGLAHPYVHALLRLERPAEGFAFLELHGIEDTDLWYAIARRAERLHDDALASELYARVFRARPADYFARELRRVDPARLVAEVERAFPPGAEPASALVRLELGQALDELGRDAEARAVALALLERAPESDDVLRLLGHVDPQEAAARLRAIADAHPGEERWVARLAYQLARTPGGSAEAERRLLAYLEDFGRSETVLEALRYAAPEAAYRLAVEQGEADASSWSDLADGLERIGARATALDARARAAALDPEDDELHGALGDALWAAGRAADARAAWARAHELEPEDEWSARLERAAAGVDPLADD